MAPIGGLIPSIFKLWLEFGLLGCSKGEALGTTPKTYDLLPIPTTGAQGLHPDAVQYAAAKTTWNKKTHKPLG